MADPSALYSGYLKASRYSGFKDADLARVLQPYRIGLPGLRQMNLSDWQSRRMASRAVVKRYLLKKSGKSSPENYTSLSIKQLQDYLKRAS